jgi:hypothetical protein
MLRDEDDEEGDNVETDKEDQQKEDSNAEAYLPVFLSQIVF